MIVARRPIMAANWKMHKTHLEAIQFTQQLSYLVDAPDAERVEVVICPPFTALRSLQTLLDADRLPYGLGALWAGAGARYSWKGICCCATVMKNTVSRRRPHEVYWWRGPDGSRLLMKWNSFFGTSRT